MVALKTAKAAHFTVDADRLAFFRYGSLGEGVVATSESGVWHVFSSEEFSEFLSGSMDTAGESYLELVNKGFIRDGFDVEYHASQFRQNKRFLGRGPSHHSIAINGEEGELSPEVAKAIVDHIMASAVESLQIVFVDDGGDVSQGILQFIRDYAKEKNQYEGKILTFELRTNLVSMTDELGDWIVEHDVSVRTLFDGLEAMHDGQREATGAAPYAHVMEWIGNLHEKARGIGKEYHEFSVSVDCTLGAEAKGSEAALLAALRERGIREFRVWPNFDSLSVEDFLETYQALVDGLLEAEAGTARIRETNARTLITRIHARGDVDDRFSRSPMGLGLTELSYDTQGNIFPSDSARRLHADGDDMFLLGKVGHITAKDITAAPTVRALTVASVLDCLPAYSDLWSLPYMGVDPVSAYVETGDLFTKFPTSSQSRAQHGMIRILFGVLVANADDADGVFQQLAG